MSVQPYMPGFESEQRRRDLSQFYTPPALAERVWKWMAPKHGLAPRILEPSAGRGALIKPLFALNIIAQDVMAYEVDLVNVDALIAMALETNLELLVRARDFLADTDLQGERYDICVMNPPFEDNQDVRFIECACEVSTRVAAICQARIVHSAGRADFWRWHDIAREAILVERPQFGGDYSPATDFVVLEIARRSTARKQGEASAGQREWW
jgi:predicted RNA methylase